MATEKQIEANRNNAQHSTGPRSESGKCRARRNAVRHGLAGTGTALPEVAEQLIAEKLVAFTRDFPPHTEDDRLTLRMVATDAVQLERCWAEEGTYLDNRALRAELFWDDDQRRDASRASKELAKDPENVALDLEMTAQGCALKVDLWASLRTTLLRNARAWSADCRSLALDLLGVRPIFRDGLTEIDPVPGADPIAFQARLAEREIDRLKARRESTVDDFDELRREHAEKGLNAPDKELTLIRRYEGTIHRRFEANLKRLRKRRETLATLRAEADPPPFDGLAMIQAAVAATNQPPPPPPPPSLDEEEPPSEEEIAMLKALLRHTLAPILPIPAAPAPADETETEEPTPAETPAPKLSRRARQERMAIDRKKARKRRRR